VEMIKYVKELFILTLYCIAWLIALVIFAMLCTAFSGFLKGLTGYEVDSMVIGLTIGCIVGFKGIIKEIKEARK
jgi:hypothetical protein